MTAPTNLQIKIGGAAGKLDQTTLVAAAKRSLQTIAPQIEAALNEQRLRLGVAIAQHPIDYEALFAAAHTIRGLAGTVGRHGLGALADVLGCYLTECDDAGHPSSDEAAASLARMIDRAYDLRESDPLLGEARAAATRLAAALGRRASTPPAR